MAKASEQNATTIDKKVVDELLTETFNSIMRIEEKSLNNRLTEGLSISELHTLCAVGLHEKSPMSDIATRLSITLATLTVAINKLEKKEYVTRIRSEEDRRQVLIELTSKGRKAVRVHDMFHKRLVDEALSDLTFEEEAVFLKAITKVKDFFDAEHEAVSAKASAK